MTLFILGLAIGIFVGFLFCAFLVVRKIHLGYDLTLVNEQVEFKKR